MLGKIILLVDDEEIIRLSCRALLDEMGYEVLLAADGSSAVEIFKQRHTEIDIVVMDMIMPNLSGREAFYQMKEIDPHCRVVISSGYTKGENINMMKNDGLSGFIQKPYRKHELSELLSKITHDRHE